jgi:hypothetical protein
VGIKRILYFLLLGVVMLTTSCKMNKFRSDDFEGSWRLETDSGIPPQAAANVATFALGHDGRFTAKSLPPSFLRIDNVKTDQALAGSGTWALTRTDGGREERVRLTFTSVEGSNGRNLPYGAELFIRGSNKDPRLYYFKGDPDENQRVTFRREPPRG